MKEENYEDNKELKRGGGWGETEKYKHVVLFCNNR